MNLSREVLHQRNNVKSSTAMRFKSKAAVKCPAGFKISHLEVLENWKIEKSKCLRGGNICLGLLNMLLEKGSFEILEQ